MKGLALTKSPERPFVRAMEAFTMACALVAFWLAAVVFTY